MLYMIYKIYDYSMHVCYDIFIYIYIYIYTGGPLMPGRMFAQWKKCIECIWKRYEINMKYYNIYLFIYIYIYIAAQRRCSDDELAIYLYI